MARLIKPDGTETRVYPFDGKTFTRTELDEIIPGTRGMTQIVNNAVAWYDTEYIMWDDSPSKRVNVPATEFLAQYHPFRSDEIRGDALIGTREEFGK